MKDSLNKSENIFNLKFTGSKKLLTYVSINLVIILVLDILIYLLFFNNVSDFINKYSWWILYLDLSVVTISGSLWYYSSYKGYISCMASMMIGMALGMQTGMMLGAVFGAVNGYFIGAMVGMILGTIVGVITGRTSIMGVLQGMMSGVMGGTMGAMITVMMFTDNVLWFMPFYMLLNIAILFGFVHMYYNEVIKDNAEVIKINISFIKSTLLCVTACILLSSLLIYAPKSIWFG
ncbi:MAG: hypothetical protein ACP5N1_01930 [Candidatus Woesearchaeota archaeon]